MLVALFCHMSFLRLLLLKFSLCFWAFGNHYWLRASDDLQVFIFSCIPKPVLEILFFPLKPFNVCWTLSFH